MQSHVDEAAALETEHGGEEMKSGKQDKRETSSDGVGDNENSDNNKHTKGWEATETGQRSAPMRQAAGAGHQQQGSLNADATACGGDRDADSGQSAGKNCLGHSNDRLEEALEKAEDNDFEDCDDDEEEEEEEEAKSPAVSRGELARDRIERISRRLPRAKMPCLARVGTNLPRDATKVTSSSGSPPQSPGPQEPRMPARSPGSTLAVASSVSSSLSGVALPSPDRNPSDSPSSAASAAAAAYPNPPDHIRVSGRRPRSTVRRQRRTQRSYAGPLPIFRRPLPEATSGSQPSTGSEQTAPPNHTDSSPDEAPPKRP